MGTSIEGGIQLTAPCYSRGILFGDTTQPKQTVYEESSTAQYTLGTLLVYADGRKFRYAKNGATALATAYMTQGAQPTANCQAETQSTSGANVEVGDQEIIIDVTSASGITDDLYAEGWLAVDSSTAAGDFYKIVSCELITSTTARLLLESPIRTAWSATSVISLVKNKWNGVLVVPTSAATSDQVATGVPLIAVTASYYCWLQTGGPCPIYVDTGDTLVICNNCGRPGTHAVAGTAGVQTAGTYAIWGQVMYISTAGAVAIVDLSLD